MADANNHIQVPQPVRGIDEVPAIAGTPIWATFSKEFTKNYLESQDQVAIYCQSLMSDDVEFFKPTNVDRIRTEMLIGFDSLDSLRAYIGTITNSYQDKCEIQKNASASINQMRTNRANEYVDSPCFDMIYSAVKFVAEDPTALRQFVIFQNPRVVISVYDLGKAKQQKIKAFLTSDSYFEVPEYKPVDGPPLCASDSVLISPTLSSAPVPSVAVSESSDLKEEMKDYFHELLVSKLPAGSSLL